MSVHNFKHLYNHSAALELCRQTSLGERDLNPCRSERFNHKGFHIAQPQSRVQYSHSAKSVHAWRGFICDKSQPHVQSALVTLATGKRHCFFSFTR